MWISFSVSSSEARFVLSEQGDGVFRHARADSSGHPPQLPTDLADRWLDRAVLLFSGPMQRCMA